MRAITEPLTYEKFVSKSKKITIDESVLKAAYDDYVFIFSIVYKSKRHIAFKRGWELTRVKKGISIG